MNRAKVRLWGREIGAVVWDEGARLAAFEYDPEFQGSGIEVSPIAMPLGPGIIQFPALPEEAFQGLPGMLADSLPDRFGHALIDEWLARRGRTPESFSPVERLCYVGTRGMGALEYEPATGPDSAEGAIEIGELVELAEAVLAKRKGLRARLDHGSDAMNRILQVGTSAGGARAKAVIAWNAETGEVRSGQAGLPAGFGHWILKLDGVQSSDDREVGTTLGYGRVEFAYHRMAVAAGVSMTECRIHEEGGRAHFMTKRFDRIDDGRKLHMQSLGALAHYDLNAAGAQSYEQAIGVMRQLELTSEEIGQQFRRTVLNLAARNQDDHVKNIAFLMDQAGRWRLSPAYDVTYSYNPAGAWTSRHQMKVNGKRDGFTMDDLLEFAGHCNLKTLRAKAIIAEVLEATRRWREFADEAGVPTARSAEIERHFRFR